MTSRPSRRREIERWWPITARGIAAVIGIEQAVIKGLGGSVDPTLMAFAGTLLLVPGIAGAQQRRNERRDEDEE